jgi:predicted thioredoxin/glutaredoxin
VIPRGSHGSHGLEGGAYLGPEVTYYTTADCHLCRVGRSMLSALQRTVPFQVRQVAIDGDEELERRFLLEVPVVEVDGEVVCAGAVDLGRVRAAVNEARMRASRDAATGG